MRLPINQVSVVRCLRRNRRKIEKTCAFSHAFEGPIMSSLSSNIISRKYNKLMRQLKNGTPKSLHGDLGLSEVSDKGKTDFVI